jgi:hypothetical protein
MGHDRNRGKDLDTTRAALASWRRLHGGRGRPIPAALWSDAADMARAHGVSETARALRLDRGRLERRMVHASERPTSDEAPMEFVELKGMDMSAGRAPTVIQFVGGDGDVVRIEVASGAHGAGVDILELARTFWTRHR